MPTNPAKDHARRLDLAARGAAAGGGGRGGAGGVDGDKLFVVLKCIEGRDQGPSVIPTG